jgi:hypothetical protein
MSLINDALKRAQEVEARPIPVGPMLRPVEPEHQAVKRAGLMLPVGLALVALCTLFFVWRLAYSKAVPHPSTHAKASAPAKPLSQEPPPAPAPVVNDMTQASQPAAPEPPAPVVVAQAPPAPAPAPVVAQAAALPAAAAPLPVPAPAPAAAPPPAPAPVVVAQAAPTPAPLAAPAPVRVPAPAPVVARAPELPLVPAQVVVPDLKLQSIVMSKRPCAMISGIIVREGDTLGSLVVKSIQKEKVELASGAQTIVLTLF